METKIASYQEDGIRLQLLKIQDYSTEMGIYYQIRKNRKVICRFKWETPARQKFNALIQQELLQTKITYTNEKSRYMCNTVGGYVLHLESGEQIKITDQEVEIMAKRYNLKKQNENYYIYNEK